MMDESMMDERLRQKGRQGAWKKSYIAKVRGRMTAAQGSE